MLEVAFILELRTENLSLHSTEMVRSISIVIHRKHGVDCSLKDVQAEPMSCYCNAPSGMLYTSPWVNKQDSSIHNCESDITLGQRDGKPKQSETKRPNRKKWEGKNISLKIEFVCITVWIDVGWIKLYTLTNR